MLQACRVVGPGISFSPCFFHIVHLPYQISTSLYTCGCGCAGQAGGRAKQMAVQEGLKEFDAQQGPEVGGVPAQQRVYLLAGINVATLLGWL